MRRVGCGRISSGEFYELLNVTYMHVQVYNGKCFSIKILIISKIHLDEYDPFGTIFNMNEYNWIIVT